MTLYYTKLQYNKMSSVYVFNVMCISYIFNIISILFSIENNDMFLSSGLFPRSSFILSFLMREFLSIKTAFLSHYGLYSNISLN